MSYQTALLALLRVIRTSISVEPTWVGEPIRVWKLDGAGTQELSQDEVNAQLQAVEEWAASERQRLFDADSAN